MPSESYVYVRVPSGAWGTLIETLELDSDSSVFDQTLRDEISDALEQIAILGIFNDKITVAEFRKAFKIHDEIT